MCFIFFQCDRNCTEISNLIPFNFSDRIWTFPYEIVDQIATDIQEKKQRKKPAKIGFFGGTSTFLRQYYIALGNVGGHAPARSKCYLSRGELDGMTADGAQLPQSLRAPPAWNKCSDKWLEGPSPPDPCWLPRHSHALTCCSRPVDRKRWPGGIRFTDGEWITVTLFG